MSYGQAIPQLKPLVTDYPKLNTLLRAISTLYWVVVQIPMYGLKVYPPVVLLATSAAYASAHFAAHANVFPVPFNWFVAASFEWVYLGTLAMASTQRGKWFYAVLCAGAITSIIYIMLYAGVQYQLSLHIRIILPDAYEPFYNVLLILILVVAHGIPLTLVNVVYSFLIHQHLKELNERVYCVYGCGQYFANERAMSGHKPHCTKKP